MRLPFKKILMVCALTAPLLGCEETIRANNSLAGTGFEGVRKLAENCTPGDFQETGVFDGDYELTVDGQPSWHDNPRDNNPVSTAIKAKDEKEFISGIELSHVAEELTAILSLTDDHELEGQIYVGEQQHTFCFFGELDDVEIDGPPAHGFAFGRGTFGKNNNSFVLNLQIGIELQDTPEGADYPPRTTIFFNISGKK